MTKFIDTIKGLKNVGVLGFSDIIGTGISAVFWFYLATLIDTEQYGEIHYFLGIAGVAFVISLIGTSNIITVYTAKNVKIQSTLYLLSLAGGLVSFIVIVSLFYRFDAAIMVFCYIINELTLSYLLGKKLYSSISKNVLLQKILTFVLGISFYYFFGVDGILYGLALSYSHFILIIYKKFKDSKIDFSLVKSNRSFITYSYLESMVGGLRGQIDKIIVVPLLGLSVLGNYALAFQVYSVLMILSNVVYKYILPQDSSGVSTKKIKQIIFIISIAITIFGIVILPLLIPTIFPKYTSASSAIQIMSMAIIPSTIGLLLVSKFLALEKGKIILFGRLISLISIILGMTVLGSVFGVVGIATAFVLSSIAPTVFFILILKTKNY